MTVIYPEATPVQGNTKVKAVLTVADPAAPSLASEINAASSVDLSCFLRAFAPSVTVNSGTAPPRLCTREQLPQEGNTQFAAIELRYPYDPQADDLTDDNKAKATLTQGTELYLVVRKGLDAREDDFAADEQVEVWKVRLGRQDRTWSGEDEFAEYEIAQMAYPVLTPEYDAVIAA